MNGRLVFGLAHPNKGSVGKLDFHILLFKKEAPKNPD